LNSGLSQQQYDAIANAGKGATGNSQQNAALQSLLGGGQNVTAQTSPYAGPNQYLDKVVNDSNRDITNSYLQGAGVQLPTQFA